MNTDYRPPKWYTRVSFAAEYCTLLLIAVVCAMLILLLSGCGGAHTKVDVHTVSREELYLRAGRSVDGWCTWRDLEYVVYCDIYMMAPEEYASRHNYEFFLEHERRHCYEGHFHPE